MAIIGRTNAGVIGFEEVIARAQAYEKAGADAICLVGIEDFDHLESIASQLSKPLMLVTYGNPNLRDNARLAALGVRIVVTGHAAYFAARSEEHTSELQSLMRISYAVFCLKKKNKTNTRYRHEHSATLTSNLI